MNEKNYNDELKWWHLWFQIKQPPQDQGIAYPIFDLIIAHKLIKPEIDKYENSILSWHFFRRWDKDEAGHVFSFYFYCSEKIKNEICLDIEDNNVYKILKNLDLIIKKDCVEKPKDKSGNYIWDNWPRSVNKNFPLFIHSISKYWLDLIDEIKEFIPVSKMDPQTFEEIQLYYQQIEANLNNEWLYRGSHFTLHHISAIFGYQPTIVDRNKIKGYLLSL
jgi:hypothetical protein